MYKRQISHTAGVIRDKVQVQEEIHTMTASKAFEQKIMSLVPVDVYKRQGAGGIAAKFCDAVRRLEDAKAVSYTHLGKGSVLNDLIFKKSRDSGLYSIP